MREQQWRQLQGAAMVMAMVTAEWMRLCQWQQQGGKGRQQWPWQGEGRNGKPLVGSGYVVMDEGAAAVAIARGGDGDGDGNGGIYYHSRAEECPYCA
jgi:hypothetical protein